MSCVHALHSFLGIGPTLTILLLIFTSLSQQGAVWPLALFLFWVFNPFIQIGWLLIPLNEVSAILVEDRQM